MIVYKITNKINGKIYIGCTVVSLKRRWLQHLNHNIKKTHIANAIRKYGGDNFICEPIEELNSTEKMFEQEIYWISHYNSTDRAMGYNITPGGDRGPIMIGKNHPNFGKPNPRWAALGKDRAGKKLDPLIVAKIKESRKGHKRSEEYKKKMSDSKKTFYQRNPVSKETGLKIAYAKKGVRSKKRTSILCLNNNKIYDGYKEAAIDLSITEGNIPQVVNGKRKHTKGFMFKKVNWLIIN